MNGGYLELFLNDDRFLEAVSLLEDFFEDYKTAPATEQEDVQMAAEDIVEYVKRMLK